MEQMTVTIESRGKVLNIGSGCSLGLLGHSGLEAADRSFEILSSGSRNGGTVTKKRLTEREISFTTDTGFYDPHTVRENIVRLLNADDIAKITVVRNGITRYIEAYSNSVEIEESNMFAPATVKLGFIAPDPFFRGIEKHVSTEGQTTEFILPMVLKSNEGTVIGRVNNVSSAMIINEGDENTGFTAELHLSLNVTDLELINSATGEYMRFSGDFFTGDTIIISTENGRKGCTLNGVSITNRIQIGSTFFQLVPGYNVVKFNADTNTRAFNMNIRYNELYLGI